ncbi:hypothetical protein GCM10017673_38810 [Streptosporangium violaceochromogenes]|nr:hypothetical protein GCM10017673_38810 [Streptosporangium violaceochromogenes]
MSHKDPYLDRAVRDVAAALGVDPGAVFARGRELEDAFAAHDGSGHGWARGELLLLALADLARTGVPLSPASGGSSGEGL